MKVAVFALLISGALQAQVATLSGTISGPSGAAVSNAKVTARTSAAGQGTETQTSATGAYSFPNLAPGDYEVAVSAPGFDAKSAKVTLGPGAAQRLDFALTAQSGTTGAPSLSDLGFGGAEAQ